MVICGRIGYCSKKGKKLVTIRDAKFPTCKLRRNANLCIYSLPVEFVAQLESSMFELLKEKISVKPERT